MTIGVIRSNTLLNRAMVENHCNLLRWNTSRDECPVYEEERVITSLPSEAKHYKRQ